AADSAAAGANALVTQLRPAAAGTAGWISVTLPRQAVQSGGFEFTLPAATAQTLLGQGTPARAALADGSPLPDWLAFDPAAMRFSAAAMPADGLPLKVVVRAGGVSTWVEIDAGSIAN
ncbi:MAG: hypothetical protein KGM91_20660, partial [Burkholderiales bacterium]|nr:hypothetical protein [Burkholderiales bacterium]